jgi:hypothetical protein
MKERDFVDFLRIALTSACAGELSQALAFSTLSKAMMTNNRSRTELIAEFLREYERSADAMRYLTAAS